MNIKFSHRYPKLHEQSLAVLLFVLLKDRKELLDDFINYDTLFIEPEGAFPAVEKFYPLPNGKYMVLIFVGNKLIPFTTVRRWTPEKEKYYRSGIGKTFGIEIKDQLTSGLADLTAKEAPVGFGFKGVSRKFE